ncbi:unnamed protein product [Ophioblennius macclurei]
MYVKFCRGFFADKKDEEKRENAAKLSVEVEGDGEKQGDGNTLLYRRMSMILGFFCLVLLLIVIFLGVKLTGSCEAVGRKDDWCSFDQCQAFFRKVQAEECQCHNCPPGWKAFGQSCFYFSPLRLSWEESRLNCTSRGGSLAIVRSQELQSFLAKEGELLYWIGLKETGAAWKWVDNTVLRESHWAEDPKKGDCGILRGSSPPEKNWIRASCQATSYFICQLNA